jgi:hypothetical protein
MGAFEDFHNISIDTTGNGQAAPGQPPGFSTLSGYHFRVEPGWTYVTKRLYGNSGFEIMILVYRLNTGLLGSGINSYWEDSGDVSTQDREWVVCGLHKNGPPNPSLPWNNATALQDHWKTITFDHREELVVEFECSGGNYQLLIEASRF